MEKDKIEGALVHRMLHVDYLIFPLSFRQSQAQCGQAPCHQDANSGEWKFVEEENNYDVDDSSEKVHDWVDHRD